jgi:hypothetical protein
MKDDMLFPYHSYSATDLRKVVQCRQTQVQSPHDPRLTWLKLSETREGISFTYDKAELLERLMTTKF